MNDTLNLLLNLDKSKLKRPNKPVEIKRLSEAAGAKVVFTIQAITLDEEQEIRDIADEGDDINQMKVRIFTVLKGVTSPNLKDEKLLQAYGASTPKQLLESGNLLQPGEIAQLYNQISALTGYGDDAVADLKNE
jgi:hypothetical protein